jgi:hypothetical protein
MMEYILKILEGSCVCSFRNMKPVPKADQFCPNSARLALVFFLYGSCPNHQSYSVVWYRRHIDGKMRSPCELSQVTLAVMKLDHHGHSIYQVNC